MSTLLRGNKDCWTFIKSHKQDGCAAFLALVANYTGDQYVDNTARNSEKRLNELVYKGERRGYNFDMYTKDRLEAHLKLEQLTEFGYTGIDERTKVRLFIEGIQTDFLQPATASVLTQPNLKSNFDACSQYYKSYLDQVPDSVKRNASGRHVSFVESNAKDDDEAVVEDRYYKYSEYKNLSKKQKAALRALKRKRGKSGSSPPKAKRAKKQSKKEREISALTKAVKELVQGNSKTSEDEDSETSSRSEPSANRALTRRR